MGKISVVSSKYIVNATIEIEGIVDRPDVIGAIFGQTEGLLGAELELRELQRSGRIGRIEVNTSTVGGKTKGSIIIPSSLDKAETAIVAASLEIIQRIGPCNAKVKVQNIEDVRISKRTFVVERAKELLKSMIDTIMPDSQEIADEVAYSVRVMECIEYGRDRLPAGPAVDESDEVIVVEGRADVLNLLKHGFKNVIGMNGTSVPQTIIDLSRKKDLVVFVDGDRGGNLILKELFAVAEIDFVTRAPDGKEVEELAKKEIHKALRSRITVEQAKMELSSPANDTTNSIRKGPMLGPMRRPMPAPMGTRSVSAPVVSRPPMAQARPAERVALRDDEKAKLGQMVEELLGTKGAYLVDGALTILGKVPLSELAGTLKSLSSGVYALVLDGIVDADMVVVAERAGIRHIIGMDSNVKGMQTRVNVVTVAEM